jgi:hypothetical protein
MPFPQCTERERITPYSGVSTQIKLRKGGSTFGVYRVIMRNALIPYDDMSYVVHT